MESTDNKNIHSEKTNMNADEQSNTTNLQENDVNLSADLSKEDNLTDENQEYAKNDTPAEPAWEEKHALLNDSYLRLMAEYDNYRKRTLREKADLIRYGGETVLRNILPIIDDFDRALEALKTVEGMQSIVEGVQLIYDKFNSYLLQQGVKKMNPIGMSFDVEMYEAVATIPVSEDDKKGKVIDCIQEGYMMYDKMLRYAKVVVGE
jgi:molecular chaperone GrpE